MSTSSRCIRLFSFLAIAVVVPVFAIACWLLLPAMAEPDFQERKGTLLHARQTGEWRVPDGRIVEVQLTSTSGLTIELALRLPREPLPQRPLLVLLSGQETGRKAVELLADTRGVAVAALSYPFGTIPHRDPLAMFFALNRIQRGILDTPPAVMLATDYLLARKDLSPGRVELAGVSFGAFLAAVPAALDRRIERLWLIHGSGDPRGVIEAGLRKRIDNGVLRHGVAWLLATTAGAHHLSPEFWVARVTPRPVIVVNALDDSALTEQAVTVLHEALRRPFEVLWSPGNHVHPKRPETIEYINKLLFDRISVQGQ